MPRPRRLPTVLTPAEATVLLRAANPRYRTGHRDRCLMQLMLNVGLRAAEVLALMVYDVDWLSGKLTVDPADVARQGVPGTGSRRSTGGAGRRRRPGFWRLAAVP